MSKYPNPMNSFDSPIFGVVSQPTTFEELLSLVIEAPPERSRVRMWRGQADISWPIHSSAYRRLAAQDSRVTESGLANYENWLLKQATHRGYRTINGQELSDLQLLARLQHHGAATRLVDATRSALVALWFCVSSNLDVVGALIGVHSDYLGGYESLPVHWSYESLLKDMQGRDYPYTWEPPIVSPRVAAQHSQFLISKVAESPSGSLCLPSDVDSTLVVAVSPKLKKIARDILICSFDIRTVTLFPDLDGFCDANSYRSDRKDMFRW